MGDGHDDEEGGGREGDELVHFEFPARPAFVGVARSLVVAVAGAVNGLDDDRVEDLRIAVSEACTNAVEAHQTDHVGRHVVLRCFAGPSNLEVRIEDSGGGFDPGAVANRTTNGEGDDLVAERGWGIQLIRALVDDVDFASAPSGTAVRLTMRLS